MEILLWFADWVLHVDRQIGTFVSEHGIWVYALLFAIVFVETGLVIMPFLPGDSLIFVAGALCGTGQMSLLVTLGSLFVAAVMGDQLNYQIGQRVGLAAWQWEGRWFNRQAFEQAHRFYERHGAITIVLARFMPFIRTFAPFVAGVARMDRATFTFYNLVGALIWVGGLGSAGYWFGNLEWVQTHLSKIIWALILVPGLIAMAGAWRARRDSAPTEN